MGCARACSAAYLLEDEASAFVALRVCIVQALEAGDREMPEAGYTGSRATNEGGDYDNQTRCVGSAMPNDRHGDGSVGEGHMSKDLTENPGKEVLMITVEYPFGASDPIHRHNAQAFVYVWRAPL